MAHEEYKEMLATSALGALDDAEAKELAAHLGSCDECRHELDRWEETAAFLALDAEPIEPSETFRSALILKLKSAPQENLKVLPSRSFPSLLMLPSWMPIAAMFLFILLLAGLFVVWRQNQSYKQEMARLNNEVERTRAEVQRQEKIVAIISSPGAQMMNLAGTEMAPAARAMLAFDSSGRAVLMTKALPPPPAGKAYQLWFITGDKKTPGKVFITSGNGDGMLEDQIPREAMKVAVFAITLEPESGASSPTGKIYLVSRS